MGKSTAAEQSKRHDEWVMLTYRMPREPSTPRSAVWRKLRQYGVAQLADGLVALPADARTREQLEWVAEEVREAGGAAGIWLATPSSRTQHYDLARSLAEARSAEYDDVLTRSIDAAELTGAERQRAIRTLRAELRRIRRRDFFPPAARDSAVAAVEALALERDVSDVPADRRTHTGTSRPAERRAER